MQRKTKFFLRGIINSDTPKRVSRFVLPLQGVSHLEPDTCFRYVVAKQKVNKIMIKFSPRILSILVSVFLHVNLNRSNLYPH